MTSKPKTDRPFLTRTYPAGASVKVTRGGYWYVYLIEIVGGDRNDFLLIEGEDGRRKVVDKIVLKLRPEGITELKEVIEEIERNDVMWREMDPNLRESIGLTTDPQLRKELERGPGNDK